MTERVVLGHLANEGLEVVRRDGRCFVRYDAGAHQVAWREDEISENELAAIKSGQQGERRAIFSLQERLSAAGVNPYESNWKPES